MIAEIESTEDRAQKTEVRGQASGDDFSAVTESAESAEQRHAQAAGMRPAGVAGLSLGPAEGDASIVIGGGIHNGNEESSGGLRTDHGTNGNYPLGAMPPAGSACASEFASAPGIRSRSAQDGDGVVATMGGTVAGAIAWGGGIEESSEAASNGPRLTEGADAVVILQDAGIGEPPEEERIKEANRRLEILKTFESLINPKHPVTGESLEGMSRAKAAAQIGVPYVTLWRWEKAYKERDYEGLIPETDKCGRKDTWEKLGFTPEQKQQIIAELKGLNLDTSSVTGTLRAFAKSDRCPPELADVILNPNRCSKHALPPSLRDSIELNKNQKNAHRGPRALSLNGIWTPRKNDILPGDIFSSDDTTPIWGYWVPWVESKEYPFGVKLLQGQLLPVIDVGGQGVITKVLIARETSSYRASDIWNLFSYTFEQIGLPRLGFQLERGSWEANIIRGVDVEYRDREVTMERRIGGLRQMPSNWTTWHREKYPDAKFPPSLQTFTSYLPKSKSIEAWFKRNQTIEGTLWGSLGRDQMREPFEKTKKIYEACRRGAADPRLHFLSQTELMERLTKIIDFVNYEPMEGEVFNGVPMLKFEQAIRDYPLFQMPEELKYLYRREWSVVTVTDGWARVRLTDPISGERYSLFYINPEVFAQIEGKQVAVYYDRENFDQPAQIIAATDLIYKGEKYQPGEFVCSAQYEERRGSFLSGDQSGHDVRRRWKNAVMSTYSTLVKHAPSRQLPPEIEQRRAETKAQRSEVRGQRSEPAYEDARPTETVTIDRRPTAAESPLAGSVTAVLAGRANIEKQRNRIAQQAAIAARLRSLRGED